MESRQHDPTSVKTVLIVDDEAGMRLALREVLRRAGWEALLAEDAAQALATLDARPDVALMITDFRMPGMKYAFLARCPVIGGKVSGSTAKDFTGFTLELVNTKTQWRSGKIALAADGVFRK